MTAATSDLMSLVESFRYGEEDRRKLAGLLEPHQYSSIRTEGTHETPAERSIWSVEVCARNCLTDYLFPSSSASKRKEHSAAVAKAAQRLLRLMQDRKEVIPGAQAGYLIHDFTAPPKVGDDGQSFVPAFERALALLAERAAKGSVEEVPGFSLVTDGFDRHQDPDRMLFAYQLLGIYRAQTGKEPGKTRNGPACRFLEKAMDPVMTFAREELGIEGVRNVCDKGSGERAFNLLKAVIDGPVWSAET